MNKIIFNYSFLLMLLMACNISYAGPPQEKAVLKDDFSAAVTSIRNPFSSPASVKKVLPVIEKKKEVAPKLVVAFVAPPEPAAPVNVNPPSLKITGTVWNSDKPQAIINGKILTLGEVVDGAKLINVRKNEIDVVFSGRQFTINSNQPVKNDSKKSK